MRLLGPEQLNHRLLPATRWLDTFVRMRFQVVPGHWNNFIEQLVHFFEIAQQMLDVQLCDLSNGCGDRTVEHAVPRCRHHSRFRLRVDVTVYVHEVPASWASRQWAVVSRNWCVFVHARKRQTVVLKKPLSPLLQSDRDRSHGQTISASACNADVAPMMLRIMLGSLP